MPSRLVRYRHGSVASCLAKAVVTLLSGLELDWHVCRDTVHGYRADRNATSSAAT